MKKAIVLLSGGVDSSVCLALALEKGYRCIALSFDYGQRHRIELHAASAIADYFECEHRVIPIACHAIFNRSSLVGDSKVPLAEAEENHGENIPSTYVPGRNTLFLSYANAVAESEEAQTIFFGPNADDIAAYPDCRPAYIDAYRALLKLASKQAVEGAPPLLETPLINLKKGEIVQEGIRLGVPFEQTHTCYQPDSSGHACKECLSCVIRRQAFLESDLIDPAF